MGCHGMEGFVADWSPIDTSRPIIIATTDVCQAFIIRGVNKVQQVISAGSIKYATNPCSALSGIPAEVKNDRHVQAQDIERERSHYHATSSGGRLELIKRRGVHTQFDEPLVFAKHYSRYGPPQCSSERGLAGACLSADEM